MSQSNELVTLEAGPVQARSFEHDLLNVYLLKFDKPGTRKGYTYDIAEFFGSEQITLAMARGVTFVDLNEHIERLQASGLRPATIRRKISAIRGFFSWLAALGLIDNNPADPQVVRRVHRGAKSERPIMVLTSAQARRLVDAASGDPRAGARDSALVLSMLYGALRRSEAAAMDFEHVRRVQGYWILDLPFTKGGVDQAIKLPEMVVESIFELCEVQGIRSGALWRSLSNNSLGKRLSERSIYDIVARAAAHAGLSETIGAHTLRHTACTLAIEGGATPQQVQAHARHKKLETTMTYVHQRDRLKDNATDYIKL